MLDLVVFHPLDLTAVLAASGRKRLWLVLKHPSLAMPGPGRPNGARVVTLQSKTWAKTGVRVLGLSPEPRPGLLSSIPQEDDTADRARGRELRLPPGPQKRSDSVAMTTAPDNGHRVKGTIGSACP